MTPEQQIANMVVDMAIERDRCRGKLIIAETRVAILEQNLRAIMEAAENRDVDACHELARLALKPQGPSLSGI